MSAGRHVFLTGATGFLGAAIARTLAARGVAVHGMARAESDRSVLAEHDVCWHEADLTDGEALASALAVCRAEAGAASLDVVHCAGLVSYRTRDAERARAVNVEGTRHVLDAARGSAVRRFLHVSSIVTLGPARPGELLREDGPPPARDLRVHYVSTKRAGEELVLAAAEQLDVVVVQPAAIFGPGGAHTNGGHLLRQLRERRLLLAPPGAVGVVGVEDVAEGCALALERSARGRCYVLAERPSSHLELLRAIARECGTRGPVAAVPRPVWSAAEHAVRAVDRVRPLERLTPQSMRMLGSSFAGDGRRAREELGWRPRPFEEALRAALLELAERGDRGGGRAG